MISSREALTSFTDAAAASVAREIASLRREAIREREVRDAQFAVRMAELEMRIAAVSEVERRLVECLATVKDGEPGRDGTNGENGRDGTSVAIDDVLPALIERGVAAATEAADRILSGWERPKDGVSVTMADVEPMLREMVAALPPAKDGRDGVDGKDIDPDVIRGMVAEAVSAIPVPKDGRDGTDGIDGRDGTDGQNGADADPEMTAALVREEVTKAVASLPPAKDGTSVTIEDVAPLVAGEVERRLGEHASLLSRQLDDAVAAIPVPKDGADGKDGVDGTPGERGPEGPMGKFPAVKEWADGVFYEGAVVTRDGGVFQALRDTGKEPGHADWLCIVARGKDGDDGRTPTVRELWSADEEYRHLDIVALNGASFIAKRDNPGQCPGDGWQLMAMQGKQGKPGVSLKGDPGRAATVTAARISDDGVLTIVNADGSAVECDLYPLLSRIG